MEVIVKEFKYPQEILLQIFGYLLNNIQSSLESEAKNMFHPERATVRNATQVGKALVCSFSVVILFCSFMFKVYRIYLFFHISYLPLGCGVADVHLEAIQRALFPQRSLLDPSALPVLP
jgi:hypothetical protein